MSCALASAAADDQFQEKEEPVRFIQQEWFDGNRRRTVSLALDEVAFFASKKSYRSKSEIKVELENSFPKAIIQEVTLSYARIKLPDPIHNKGQLKDYIRQYNAKNGLWKATPVYHNAPSLTSPVFIAPDSLIVHFYRQPTRQFIDEWSHQKGLAVIKIINGNLVAIMKCSSTENCLDDANRAKRDQSVEYAYPNWIRPRRKKLQGAFFNGGDADLSVSQSATPDPALVGKEVMISITSQVSPASGWVKNFRIQDHLADGFVLRKATIEGGRCQGTQIVDCRVDAVFGGKTISAKIIAKPLLEGKYVNKVSVESDASDPDLSNNVSSMTLTVVEGKDHFPWNDPLYERQWYLENFGQGSGLPGADVNVLPVWRQGIKGQGILTAIVDDGLEIDHEDLRDNVARSLSWDFLDKDDDPTGGFHGTSVAGIVAATGNNLKGVVGSAPNSQIFGLRLLGANSDSNEAEALSYRFDITDLYNNSWGPPDDGRGLYGPSPLTLNALREGVTKGRNGKGTIYCWAAGNGGDNDNSNYDGYANSRFTLAFTASTNEGNRAFYAEKGANILANVPSGGGTLEVTTTDRSGFDGLDNKNYTNQFGGTSAASPLACGIVALLLEVNPNLSWRDVQAIIAATASKNDPTDSDWSVNGSGYHINHKYGFGRIDSAAAVEAAKNWELLRALKQVVGSAKPQIQIPDNQSDGISSTIRIAEDLTVESVEVVFSANDHPYWGDLDIRLISPSGTESILAEKHNSGQGTAQYDRWTFNALRYFGESSLGDWTLTVRDLAARDVGTFQSWELTVYGTDGDSQQYVSDLALSVDHSQGLVTVNEPFSYLVSITNNGPDEDSGVTLNGYLAENFDLVSIQTSQGRCSGNRLITCELGSLARDEKTEISINLNPTVPGDVSNRFSITGNGSDPISNNNTETVETNIVAELAEEYQVSITTNGQVVSTPEGIDCPTDCQEKFLEGTSLRLKVVAPENANRFFWLNDSRCFRSEDICELTVDKNISLKVLVY